MKKAIDIITNIAITLAYIASLVFLIILLDKEFSGTRSNVVVAGRKPGYSISSQTNAGSITETGETPEPSTTPDDGLPFIEGFNTGMSLERISIWWDGYEADGRASSDSYLRASARAMFKLEAELENYSPPEDMVPLKFKTQYNGGNEQEITIFQGNVAKFEGLEGRYFKIPDIYAIANGMLSPPEGTPSVSVELQMESSTMLAYYSSSANRVILGYETVSKLAREFYSLEKVMAKKPAEVPERTLALVFYYHGIKNYVDIYETGLIRFNNNNVRESWYTAEGLDAFDELVRNSL